MMLIVLLALLISSIPSLDIGWNIFNTSVAPEFSYLAMMQQEEKPKTMN